MLAKIWILNAILGLALVVIGVNVQRVWRSVDRTITTQTNTVDAPEKEPPLRSLDRRIDASSVYRVIVGKNLFAPYRREFESPPELSVEKAPIASVTNLRASNEKVVLYGVIILGDYRRAIVLHSTASKTGEIKQKWVTVGDTLGVLSVDRIEKDRIYLSGDSERYELLLYDKEKTEQSMAAELPVSTPQAQVIQTSPGLQPRQDVFPPETLSKTVLPPVVDKSDDASYEVIDTPFGLIKRKKRD